MSWLRLDFCGRLVLLGGVLLGNGFRSPLEVLFTELELRHCPTAFYIEGLPRL